MAEEPPVVDRPTTSQRDPEMLRAQLEQWLAGRLAEPQVSDLEIPASNGMSSETVLFRVGDRELVARIAPDRTAMPVFPAYDMERQVRTMQAVRDNSSVPVPRVLWSEMDTSHLGAPFFIMERVNGEVPPDVMPYNFGSWITEATAEQRRQLQDSSVSVLASLHGMPPGEFTFLGGPSLRDHVNDQWSYYQWVGGGSPLIERCFQWLDHHWPSDESPAAFSWGDARIGNMMYQDFAPVAVFDWEMAGIAPPEVDLGWFVFLHRFFEDIAANFELPGLPDFLRLDDVCAKYAEVSGHEPRDMEFYTLYAALRHAIIMFRIQQRAIHFGEASPTEDPDDMIMHANTLRAMLAGEYWKGLR